jgi:hypothetical protein
MVAGELKAIANKGVAPAQLGAIDCEMPFGLAVKIYHRVIVERVDSVDRPDFKELR